VFRFRILAAKNSRNFVAAFSPALARIAGTVWAWRSQCVHSGVKECPIPGILMGFKNVHLQVPLTAYL
jgi:hypothetical protein